MKVLAAIVTYNRSKLLERCIDHVLSQTRAPDALIVINNSSPDDTEEMLQRRGIDYITQPNVGGAGGFSRAIAHAVEGGFDAVWLMDDDGFPGETALQHLTGGWTDDTSCLSCVVLREDDPTHFVWPFPVLDRDGLPAIFAKPRKIARLDDLRPLAPGGTYPFAHLFNGALVSVRAIRQIGNVETGFFIFGDEVDYYMRLRKVGRAVSHLDAHHYHPDVANRPLTEAKFYYYVKNTIILNRRHFNKAGLRNVLTVGVALARVAARNGVRTGLSLALGRNRKILRQAVSRGLRGQVGTDFLQ